MKNSKSIYISRPSIVTSGVNIEKMKMNVLKNSNKKKGKRWGNIVRPYTTINGGASSFKDNQVSLNLTNFLYTRPIIVDFKELIRCAQNINCTSSIHTITRYVTFVMLGIAHSHLNDLCKLVPLTSPVTRNFSLTFLLWRVNTKFFFMALSVLAWN